MNSRRMKSARIGMLSIFSVWLTFGFAQSNVTSEPGMLNAKTWNFSKRLPLKGNWTFFENQLLSPQTLVNEHIHPYSFFPAVWNDLRPEGSGSGYATYALKVVLPDSMETLALEIPQMYSSYKLWANGDLIASAGGVGVDDAAVTPQWIYQTVSFNNHSDTLQIVLQIANFHHYKGGAKDPLYLGRPTIIQSHFQWAIGSNLIGAFILLLEGIFFLLFYNKKKRRVILYFALLCVTWSVRSIFSNLYPPVLLYPDFNWQLLVKIEYISLYLMVIWAALFFNALFKDISNVIFTYLPITLNLFFIAFTLFTPAIIFSRWVSIYLGVAALVIAYGATLIVRALIVEREGSWYFMSSLGIGILIFGYDIAAYQSSFSYNVVLLNIGYVVIFMLTTVALLFHLEIFKSKNSEKNLLTYDDLFKRGK